MRETGRVDEVIPSNYFALNRRALTALKLYNLVYHGIGYERLGYGDDHGLISKVKAKEFLVITKLIDEEREHGNTS